MNTTARPAFKRTSLDCGLDAVKKLNSDPALTNANPILIDILSNLQNIQVQKSKIVNLESFSFSQNKLQLQSIKAFRLNSLKQ